VKAAGRAARRANLGDTFLVLQICVETQQAAPLRLRVDYRKLVGVAVLALD